jgi:uncharacterized iron-regulated protein
MCRARGAPVIAANTPRRLVREYRTARLPFDEFRASRSPEDQRWLPSTSEHLEGPYFERFIEVMKSHPPAPTATAPASAPAGESVATQPHATDDSAPSEHDREALVRSFRPQLLWDDTMAESVANFRAAHSFRRVMLIVGRFHVEHQGGTLQKFRQRRPDDRVCTLVYTGRPDAAFAIDPEDVGAGDIVLSGISPPDTPTQPPQPTTAPAPAP